MARGHEPFAPPVAGLLVSRAVLQHQAPEYGMSAQRLEADIHVSGESHRGFGVYSRGRQGFAWPWESQFYVYTPTKACGFVA